MNQLRSSGSVAQISDVVIALERDQQSKTDKNKSSVRVLKNRFTGELGIATNLTYNPTTGRFSESPFENEPTESSLPTTDF